MIWFSGHPYPPHIKKVKKKIKKKKRKESVDLIQRYGNINPSKDDEVTSTRKTQNTKHKHVYIHIHIDKKTNNKNG